MQPQQKASPSLFASTVAGGIRAGDAIGRYLERGRLSWLPRYAYLAAAQIDLAIPSLGLVGASPFNAQVNRMDIFRGIIDTCGITTIVETGTCRGATTEFMASNFGGRVYSCEVDPRYFEYAKARLKRFSHVEPQLMDSRKCLEKVFSQPQAPNETMFHYLDAHWNEDLPLLEEISLVFDSKIPAVVMIDDFAVPFDEGYGFDVYGGNRKLCLKMLSEFRDRMDYVYFPALPASSETGPRRGSVIFATSSTLNDRLAALPSLRRATARDWDAA